MVTSSPTFLGVIEDGNSTISPQPSTLFVNASAGSLGFGWVPISPVNTMVYLVAGDESGPGAGGVVPVVVGNGDMVCLGIPTTSIASASSTGQTPGTVNPSSSFVGTDRVSTGYVLYRF